ncbi:MAG TPA: hypothetical protein VFZ91_11785 [Allosphingosinicella sp.]
MSILIFSVPGDSHPIVISHALDSLGIEHQRIFLTNLPQRAELSYALTQAGAALSVRGATEPGTELRRDVRTVWFRRVGAAMMGNAAHPQDREYAVTAWIDVLASARLSFLAASCFCINDPKLQRSADNKAYQLNAAREAGLRVPDTLITNSEADALSFIESNRQSGRRTVAKPFSPMLWYTAAETHAASAEVVSPDEVKASNLRASPAIFQALVEKDYEVRVTVMGRTLIASRHEIPPELRGEIVDFRLVPDWSRLRVSPVDVPPALRPRILEMMSALGLVFGSMDFVVGADGAWTFLEVNEQGNFLWQEHYSPETPIVDAFCRFLASGTSDFEYAPADRGRLRLSRLRETLDLGSRIAEEKAANVGLEKGVGVSEED